MTIPGIRLHGRNDRPIRADREHVLYWMIAQRRTVHNFALDQAVDRASELGLPLVILEPLRVDYRWACDRFHRFVIDGMRDNARALARSPVAYHPYVEPRPGAGRGLLEALASRAAVVITDEFPTFFLPRMVDAAAARLDVRLESVDGNGLLPLRAADREFVRAFDFRRHLHRALPSHLADVPRAAPLAGLDLPAAPPLPASVLERWPAADLDRLGQGDASSLADLPIDHDIGPAGDGGAAAGARRLAEFLQRDLPRYAERRNVPDADVASRLSPFLHFGHVSPHQVLAALADATGLRRDALEAGSCEPTRFWGVPETAASFLDELVTWRELGFHFAHRRADHDRYEAVPEWARRTLDLHRDDPRDPRYAPADFDRARTHDALWNAAQNQLRRSGRIHNYLRMLWGKKVLHWARSPEAAFDILVELNNRYATDGRDPNSYCGISWTFGRFDRPWGPERPIFGTVRYMTSDNTRRKVSVKRYLAEWA